MSTVTGGASNGAVDLGASLRKFKDLYLSGGVYLGGTGSANKLDDYEEGTWTPTITLGGASTGIAYNIQQAVYTKIGDLVTAYCYVHLSSKGTATGQLHLQGLPFTTRNQGNLYPAASLYINNATSISGMVKAYANPNSTTVIFVAGDNSVSALQDTNIGNATDIMINISYRV
jgi:hypothetical protein